MGEASAGEGKELSPASKARFSVRVTESPAADKAAVSVTIR